MSNNQQIKQLEQTLIINVLLVVSFAVSGLMLGVSIINLADYLTTDRVSEPAVTTLSAPVISTPTIAPTTVPTPYAYPDRYEVVVSSENSNSDLENDTDRKGVVVTVLKDGNDFFSIDVDIINHNRTKDSIISTRISKFDETDDSIVPEILMVNNFDNSLHSIGKMFELAAEEADNARLYDYMSREEMEQ